MTKETTPPPPAAAAATEQTAVPHEPPSLPNSPLAKRTKTNTTQEEEQTQSATMTKDLSTSQPPPPLLVKKLSDKARAPTRGSAFAAGYDVYSAKETIIPAKGKALVDTGIAIAVPAGTCMLTFSICGNIGEYLKERLTRSNRRPHRPPQRPRVEALH